MVVCRRIVSTNASCTLRFNAGRSFGAHDRAPVLRALQASLRRVPGGRFRAACSYCGLGSTRRYHAPPGPLYDVFFFLFRLALPLVSPSYFRTLSRP